MYIVPIVEKANLSMDFGMDKIKHATLSLRIRHENYTKKRNCI